MRICAENGTWLWGNWTNYTECLDSLDDTEAILHVSLKIICFKNAREDR